MLKNNISQIPLPNIQLHQMYRFLPILLLLTACQGPDLTGHWHIETIYFETDGPSTSTTEIFTFRNDTLVSMWESPIYGGGIYGYHDSWMQTISFSAECLGNIDWNYSVISKDKK